MIEISFGSDPFQISNAVAVWAGVIANLAVVISAFVVQRFQATSDRRLADREVRLASSNSAAAAGHAANALCLVPVSLQDAGADLRKLVDTIERHILVIDYMLTQPMPDYETLGSLIEVRRDARVTVQELTGLMEPGDVADALAAEMSRSALIDELTSKQDRWLSISARCAHEADRVANMK